MGCVLEENYSSHLHKDDKADFIPGKLLNGIFVVGGDMRLNQLQQGQVGIHTQGPG